MKKGRQAKEKERKMRKKSLKVIFAGITALLLFFSAVGIAFGALSLQDSQNQQMDYARNLAELYMDNVHDELEKIDYLLIDMVVNDADIKELGNIIPDSDQTEDIVKKKKISDAILERFASILTPYNTKYNLFFYNPKQDLYITKGDGDYAFRQKVQERIRELVEEDSISLTKKDQLFPEEETKGLFSVYKMGDNYIGSYISFDDFAKPLLDMNRDLCESVSFLDRKGNSFYEKENKDARFLHSAVDRPFLIEYEFSENIFSVQIALKNTVAFQTHVLQQIFRAIAVCSIAAIVVVILYIRRKLIRPVKQFQEEIKRAELPENFRGNTGIAEIDEAGEKIGTLSNENLKLQMKVYEEQMRRQETELDFMNLQIRPHFYINCLNSIYIMAQMNRTEEIQKLSIYVSNYLRGVLPSGMRFVRLEEELKLVDNYLEIQKIMRGWKFEYRISCENCYYDISIPTLSIQSFVENSVKYASREQGSLVIEVQVEEDPETEGYLSITVEDNGAGFSEETLEQLAKGEIKREDNSRQIGILNVVQRFQLLYGDAARISFENREQGGAKINILLPETQSAQVMERQEK